jgi:hypothetical protein
VRDRQRKINVGLKYCGGCRARFDRVALVDALRKRLAETVEFVAADNEDAEEILIVCGCSTACAKVETDRPVWYVACPEDAERWLQKDNNLQMHGRGYGLE